MTTVDEAGSDSTSRTGHAGHDHETPGPVTASLVWATWALFAGLGLMLVGAGLFGTLIGARTELDGFNALSIGLVSAAYYGGFMAGSRIALRALGTVGHIRVYAALASLMASSILVAGLLPGPIMWTVLRFIAGASLAGQYVVAESWLNKLVSNDNRGRVLSLYVLTTIVAYGGGQLWFSQLDPQALTGFAIAAILISLAVTPVALSADAAPPKIEKPERMSLRELLGIVPTGVVTSVLVGITHGAFLGLSVVYAARAGLSIGQIGLFVAMPTVGSLVLSVPVSSLSDETDRRLVGALAATAACGAAIVLLLVGADSWLGFVAMAVIGGMTFPLYSIAGAYTNDWVPTAKLTAAASQLVMLFGAGAFVGPLIGSALMSQLGAEGFVWMTIATHGVIAVFLFVRIVQFPAAIRAKPWNAVPLGRAFYLPATAVAMGRRMAPWKRQPRRDRSD